MPRVNLLPPEVVEVRRFRRVQYGLGGAVLAAVGVVVLLMVLANGSVASAQQQLDSARSQQVQLQHRVQKLNGVRQTYTQVAAAQAQLQGALSGEVQWSQYLNDLSLTIPANVWLTNFSATLTGTGAGSAASPTTGTGTTAGGGTSGATTAGIGTLTASGNAFSLDDVAAWLVSLGQQPGYADPYLSNSTATTVNGRRIYTFNSTVTVTAAALSHRFDRVAGGAR